MTPITAINHGLRGHHPPPSFEGRATAVLGLREEATPEVCGQLESIFHTVMSPEQGALDKDDLKQELDKVIDKLEVRRSARLLTQQILAEREEMEKRRRRRLPTSARSSSAAGGGRRRRTATWRCRVSALSAV